MKKCSILILILVIFSFENIYATQGCCSRHGGVDCSRIQSNGNVICMDGYMGSSCSYSSMAKCKGVRKSSNQKANNINNSNKISIINGCTDKTANNYNNKANKDDGSCTYDILGCTDKTANNYNSEANKEDGSCTYDILGCTDETANNYNNKANKDDGSCTYDILGCTDKTANNYNNKANKEDGSCTYDPLTLKDSIIAITILTLIIFILKKFFIKIVKFIKQKI